MKPHAPIRKPHRLYKERLAEVTEPSEAEKIRLARRAWLSYRDAYIVAMYPAKDKQGEYGTTHAADVALLTARLTQWQIVALRELLQR